MKWIRRLGNWRQLVMRTIGWLHCAMIYALFYCAVFRLLQGEETLRWTMWRGLLSIIPLAVADLAGEFCRKLWQFSLVSLGACGLAWVLLGHPATALPIAVVCFFRGKNRLSEEPVESMLDRPQLPLVLVVLLPFFYSALGGGPSLQKVCLIWAALYVLLYGAWVGFERIQRYLSLNQNMAGVPVKRIVRTSGLAVIGMVLLAGGLLLPALLLENGYFRIDPQQNRVTVETEIEPVGMTMPSLPQELLELGEGSTFQIPPFVSYLFTAVIGAAVIVCLFYGIYLVLRNFRGTFVDHRDVVQYLRGPEEQSESVPKKTGKRIPLWDRTPNAQVRRKYRREILRMAKEKPPGWAAPREIEETVGLQDQRLHQLYEKARYSQKGCTAQELKDLKR